MLATSQVFPGEGPSQFDQTFPAGTSQVDAQHGTFLDRFLTMGGAGPILVSNEFATSAVAAASSETSLQTCGPAQLCSWPVVQLDSLVMRAASRQNHMPTDACTCAGLPTCRLTGHVSLGSWWQGFMWPGSQPRCHHTPTLPRGFGSIARIPTPAGCLSLPPRRPRPAATHSL
jgi:hypothetical protein